MKPISFIMDNDLIIGRGSRVYHDIFTPPAVAKRIADEHIRPLFINHLQRYPNANERPAFRILEPSVGSGNLLWPVIDLAIELGIALDIIAFDVQQDYLEYVQRIVRER